MKMNENDWGVSTKIENEYDGRRKKKKLFRSEFEKKWTKNANALPIEDNTFTSWIEWAMDVKYITAKKGAILNILAIYILI